jgi:hypothetical protein
MSRSFRFGQLSPMLGLACGMVTLSGTYFLSSYFKHIPAGLSVPFISLNGVQYPEYVLYSTGFTATGICIFSSARFARKHFFPTIESNLQKYASVSFWSASIASVGLLIQAIIPLQRDIQDVIAGTSPLRTQSIIHQTAALILFLAGYVHCISTDILVWKTRSLPNNAGSRWFKTVLTFLAISPFLISFVPHPASGGSGNLEEMTYGAIGQWICVLSLLLYFASYHFEFTFVRLPTTSSSSGNEGHDMNPLLVQRSTATD